MINTSEMQWIQGCGGEPMADAYTLVLEDGTPVAFVARQSGMWQGYWYEGTDAGQWDRLGEAMDHLERIGAECDSPECDSPTPAGSTACRCCSEEGDLNG